MKNINSTARIMIVDDTEQNIQLLGQALAKEGYEIIVATNGAEAIKTLEHITPDLILLDVMMPQMDGFEACSIIKKNEKTKNIPIIFLTARVETEDIVKGFELGAVDYIAKPFNLMELYTRVKNHLELKKRDNDNKELIHILAHDLATPFNAIISLTEILDLFNDVNELKTLIGQLNTTARNAKDLIDLVRKMRSLEEGKIELAHCNLTELIRQAVELLKDKLKAKNISVNMSADEKVEVLADKISLLNSVLLNLLTNAIKFSYPASEINICVEKQNNKVRFSITDTGIGMPESLLEKLFEMNRTTSRPGTQNEKGTGFGMPLIKKFILAYGAEINIKSVSETDNPSSHGTTIEILFNS